MGVVAEAAHGLGLTTDAGEASLVEAFGLDYGKGDVTVEAGVAGEVDAFAAALAEESLDDVAAAGEGGGESRGRRRCAGRRGVSVCADGGTAGVAESRAGVEGSAAGWACRGERFAARAAETRSFTVLLRA
jgi:hypothetical protein